MHFVRNSEIQYWAVCWEIILMVRMNLNYHTQYIKRLEHAKQIKFFLKHEIGIKG